MDRPPLYPGTSPFAARTPWFLLAVGLAMLSLCGLPQPWAALLGTLALVAAGILFRRFILFPAVAVILFLIEIFAGSGDLYRWLQYIMRGILT